MTTRNSSTSLALLISTSLLFAGCHLERSALNGMGQVTPAQYCPGDVAHASFDLLREETCPPDVDCAAYFPTLNISSSPEVFPPRSVSAFADGFDFTPTGDRVDVTFDIDRDVVTIPTSRFEGESRVFVQRTNLRDHTHTITRYTGMMDHELLHEGMCMGNTPVNLPAELPGPPRLSPNLRLVELCNTNAVPVTIELIGTAGSFSRNVLPGRCLQPGVDGVPADLANARTVGASAPDLSARCSATMQMPPRPLRTAARLACR